MSSITNFFKKDNRNLKALFSVICVSVIALGTVVYFTTKPASDVNENTTIVEEKTTAVQRSVTIVETTTEESTAATEPASQAEDETEPASMPQTDSNTPYKSFYQYPISETVLSGYTQELVKNETMGDYRSHPAVDFKGEAGDDIYAVNDGLVLSVYNNSLSGMTVEIDHGGKLVAKYCGFDSVAVSEGDEVQIGQVIGTLGAVPFEKSSGSHLHFETKLAGEYVDPLSVMGKTE